MSVNSKIFNEDYYLNLCFGNEEFKKSKGLKLTPKIKEMLDKIPHDNLKVLEIGCGRGDSAVYIAHKAKYVYGIDYSKDAIKIADNVKSKANKNIQKKIKFSVMKADNLKFKDKSFDLVIMIDTFDHFNSREINRVFREINRILKPGGNLFIKTCANKILLDYTYSFFIRPMNILLTGLDKFYKNQSYESYPMEARTKEARLQHVNEADYFYLKKILSQYNFYGKIWGEVGFLTPDKSYRSKIYNFITTLYPISKFMPLNILFAHTFFAFVTKPVEH